MNTSQEASFHEILARIEADLGFVFSDQTLLRQALTHSSFAYEQSGSKVSDNETLEFLGDAVLDLAIGMLIFQRFPEMKEGELTRLRAALVNERHLAKVARQLELDTALLLGRGEEASGGRRKPSILSSVFEAVIGAVFVDGGYDSAVPIIAGLFGPWIESGKEQLRFADAKSRLQEFCQERYNEAPGYVLEKAEGPDHDKLFTVTVRFRGAVLATGTARNKKEAEKKAATIALRNFDLSIPESGV